MDPKPPGAWDLRKLLVLVLGVCLVAATGIGFRVTSLRNRNWANLERRVEELREHKAPPLARLPLARTLVPGNAWDDYLASDPYHAGRPIRMATGNLIGWIEMEAGPSRAEIQALLSENAPFIEWIRKGARREFARIPETLTRKGYGVGDEVWLCLAKARMLAKGGEAAAALELLVDLSVYGRDVTAIPGAAKSSLQILELAFRQMKNLMQRHELPREEWRRLSRALQVLDEHFPDPADDFRVDLLEFGQFLQREDREEPRRSWRYCFSSRLQAASEFSVAEDLVRRALDLHRKPWSVAGPGNLALVQEKKRSPGPFAGSVLDHIDVPQRATSTRGFLRLLWAGAHYQAEGVVPTLEDPVSGTIQSQIIGNTVVLRRRPIPDYDWNFPPASRNYADNTTLELPRAGP